jgi:hypothetical protein
VKANPSLKTKPLTASSRSHPHLILEFNTFKRTLNFCFHDTLAFINCRRILLDITVSTKDTHASNKDRVIATNKYVTTSNPPSHTLIDQIHVNVGQCLLDKNDSLYPMIAELKYLTEFNKASKETWLKEFEGYDSELDEAHPSNDVRTSGFKLDTNSSTYKPINGIGRRAKKLWSADGGKETYRLELFTALSTMDTLIPNNVPVSIKLLLTSNERYYLTKTDAVLPKFIVHEAFMFFQVVLLKDLGIFLRSSGGQCKKMILLINNNLYHQIRPEGGRVPGGR